jgi:xanthine dehydrogenase accessory factor
VVDHARHDHDHAHEPDHEHEHDAGCAVAHGDASQPSHDDRELVVVYATALGSYLAHWGRELGFRVTLLEPDTARVTRAHRAGVDAVFHDPASTPLGPDTDVVVTDHHRDDLGPVLAPLVTATPRWVGIIGSPRHEGPHVAALAALGLDHDVIATVRRPIGVDIGSKAPAEIALSILAGLVADRNGRTGGLPRTEVAAAG